MNTHSFYRRRLPFTPAALLASFMAGALLLGACGHPGDDPVNNQAPFVRLTGGPVARAPGQNGIALKDSVNYWTEFLWTGWDEDGIIDHYQYTIDIPDNLFSERDNPNPTGIVWTDTTAFRANFLFTTATQDSFLNWDGTWVEPPQWRSDHTFYVRAVDNEGAVSKASYVTFTARSATPDTKITVPSALASAPPYLSVGSVLNVAWQGIDPDSPDPRKKPVYYEWRLIDIGDLLPKIMNLDELTYYVIDPAGPGESKNEDGTPKFPWHRVGADTTRLTLLLDAENGRDYLFAIRGVDEAGAIESKFVKGKNAALLSASRSNTGSPILTISERMAGSWVFDTGAPWEIETPVGRCLRFDFKGDASAYGGEVQAYNYGIDVADAEQDGPNSGFRGWSDIEFTFEPICFRFPGIHTLTVKTRDTGGGVSISTVIMKVVDFPMDREVLYVDDYIDRNGVTAPNDATMDARTLDWLTSIGYTTEHPSPKEIFQIDTFGPGDINYLPTLLKLSDLARYKQIIWSVYGNATDLHTALVAANACRSGHILQAYVGAGGSLLIYGQAVYANFKTDLRTEDCKATAGYSESSPGLDFAAGSFVTDFLGVVGGDFRTARKDSKTNGLVRAAPTLEAASQPVPFPPVEVDSTILRYSALGGIPYEDAMFQPTVDHSGGLDTLYTIAVTAKSASAFKGKPVALRYADPDRVSPEQGPVAVFGMNFVYLKQGEVHQVEGTEDYQGTGCRGLVAAVFAWFRQNGPPARAALSPQ